VLQYQALTERVIGLVIEVHRTVGPGLLEAVHTGALALGLEAAGAPFAVQVIIPVSYKTKTIPLGFLADILVDGIMMPEIKAVPALVPAHEAQLRINA
jgi:GxxExxY protein